MTGIFNLTTTTGNGQGTSVSTNLVDQLISGFEVSRSTTPISGGKPFLRLLKSGQLAFGQSDDPVQKGSEWAINPLSMMHGWVCWTNDPRAAKNELLGEVMVPATSPKPPRPEPISGNEFKEQRSFELKCVTGEDEGVEVLYNVNSKGGMKAVDVLISKMIDHMKADKTYIVPVVQLGSDYYNHTKYGQTFFPTFAIVDWMDIDGNPSPGGEPAEDATTVVPPVAAAPAKPVREKAPLQEAAQPGSGPRRQRPGGRV
jgi:hypothetical protein